VYRVASRYSLDTILDMVSFDIKYFKQSFVFEIVWLIIAI